jgi:hypothetical protein
VSEFHHFFLQRVHEGLSAPPPGQDTPAAAAAGSGVSGEEGEKVKEGKGGGVVEGIFGGTMRQEVFVQAGPDQPVPSAPASPGPVGGMDGAAGAAGERGAGSGGAGVVPGSAGQATASVSASTAEFMELILGLGPGSLHGTPPAAERRVECPPARYTLPVPLPQSAGRTQQTVPPQPRRRRRGRRCSLPAHGPMGSCTHAESGAASYSPSYSSFVGSLHVPCRPMGGPR